jgi:hypothetical protein
VNLSFNWPIFWLNEVEIQIVLSWTVACRHWLSKNHGFGRRS